MTDVARRSYPTQQPASWTTRYLCRGPRCSQITQLAQRRKSAPACGVPSVTLYGRSSLYRRCPVIFWRSPGRVPARVPQRAWPRQRPPPLPPATAFPYQTALISSVERICPDSLGVASGDEQVGCLADPPAHPHVPTIRSWRPPRLRLLGRRTGPSALPAIGPAFLGAPRGFQSPAWSRKRTTACSRGLRSLLRTPLWLLQQRSHANARATPSDNPGPCALSPSPPRAALAPPFLPASRFVSGGDPCLCLTCS